MGCTVLLLAAAYLWGIQTVLTLEYVHMGRKPEILWITPQSLLNLAVSQTEGTKLSNAGFEFEVPWNDLNAANITRRDSVAVFIFRSGIGISFLSPGTNLISGMKTQSPSSEALEGVRRLLGDSATQSDYALRNAILDASPEMLKPWISKREAIRVRTLLSIKESIDSGHGGTGIFRIGANDWKGFQFDDPVQKPGRVLIDLYDSQDHHIEMVFQTPKDASTEVTQADINRAIGTLRAVGPDISQ